MENLHPTSNDRRDPICGMVGTIERHSHWFCSVVCLAKYEKQLGIECAPPHIAWWKDRALWALFIVAVPLALGWVWPAAQPVAQVLWQYLSKAGWAVFAGLLIGGVVDHYVPKEYIGLVLAGSRRRTIFTAAGLGFLASSCSHGCLALTMELYRKGASVPAVITFLLASPWASLSLTLLIISLLGWKGLLIVVMALGVSVSTGFVFQRLERKGVLEPNPNRIEVRENFSVLEDMKERFRRRSWTARAFMEDVHGVVSGAWGLAQMVLLWVAIGFTVSALIGSFVPHGWWSRYLGPTIPGLLLTLVVATAVEVCSEGTAPLAVEIYKQTGALGNAFAFLMAGVVTDFTELSLVWVNIGKQAVFWLMAVTLPQVFLLGLLMNYLLK